LLANLPAPKLPFFRVSGVPNENAKHHETTTALCSAVIRGDPKIGSFEFWKSPFTQFIYK
jgi:hypothetical protein